MTDNTVPWFQRLWGTVEEPKWTTTIMVAGYLVAIATAIGFIVVPTPHPLPYTNLVLQVLAVGMLALGGIIGAPMAWLGRWWVERSGAALCLGGVLVTLFDVVVLLLPGGPSLVAPVLTVGAVGFSVVLFASRLSRVNKQPYAPGRGPETPEMRADKLLAHIIAEDTSHGRVTPGDE